MIAGCKMPWAIELVELLHDKIAVFVAILIHEVANGYDEIWRGRFDFGHERYKGRPGVFEGSAICMKLIMRVVGGYGMYISDNCYSHVDLLFASFEKENSKLCV